MVLKSSYFLIAPYFWIVFKDATIFTLTILNTFAVCRYVAKEAIDDGWKVEDFDWMITIWAKATLPAHYIEPL
jgi:hypothetical protein